MLLDLTQVPAEPSNVALEYLCKAVEDRLLDEPHPTDPFLGAVENLATDWMGQVLTALYDQALHVFTGRGGVFTKAALPEEGPQERCRKLEARIKDAEPGTLDLTTYLDVIDCLMVRYMPASLQDRAKRQAVKQYMAGHYRQRKPGKYGPSEAAGLPETVEAATRQARLHPIDQARLQIAEAAAARHVTDLTAAARSRMQNVLLAAERGRVASGEAAYSPQRLQQALRDEFGELNRDWRRIAVTETAINAADGYLGAAGPGEQVQWLAHPGACAYCERMHGRVFRVVPSGQTAKDPETEMWAGKHAMNVGRAISAKKRTEAGLVDREPEERVVPAIPAHPNCRCLLIPAVMHTRKERAA